MARLVVKADKDFIQELEQQEEIGAAAISQALKKSGESSPLSISDFYPELGETREFGYMNCIQDVPLMTQIPFFSNKILVKIEPFRTPELFQAQYGISVDTMVELIKRGLVIPVVSSDLRRYIGLNYLAPILSMPRVMVSSVRNKYFFLTLSPNYERYIEEGKNLFKQKFVTYSKEWQKKYRTGSEAFVTARAKRFARLKVMTPQLAEMVSEQVEQGPALVDMLDLIFIDPYTTALEGTLTIDEAVYRRIVQAVPLLSEPERYEVFQSQIAEHILRYFQLRFPGDLTLNQLDKFQKSELPKRCHEILVALNAAVYSKPDDAENRAKELLEHWQETINYLDSILRQRRDWEGLIAGGSIMMVGAGAALATGQLAAGGLAASIAGAAHLLPFIARIKSGIAEQLAKLRKPKLACIMLDFKKAADEIIQCKREM